MNSRRIVCEEQTGAVDEWQKVTRRRIYNRKVEVNTKNESSVGSIPVNIVRAMITRSDTRSEPRSEPHSALIFDKAELD